MDTKVGVGGGPRASCPMPQNLRVFIFEYFPNDIDEIFWNIIDAKAFIIIADLIPRDLYQSSEAPAAGSEDKTNCAEKFSRKPWYYSKAYQTGGNTIG